MAGLMLKLAICPAAVVLADWLFGDVYYPKLYQAILTGWVLAVTGHLMEVLFLKRGTLWTANLLDWVAATLMVYLSGFVASGARITWLGALMTGFLIAATEHFQHVWLLKTGEARKGPV
jgi:hypothetical protein